MTDLISLGGAPDWVLINWVLVNWVFVDGGFIDGVFIDGVLIDGVLVREGGVDTVGQNGVPLIRQLEHFAEVIAGRAEPLVSAKEGRATLAATLKIEAETLPKTSVRFCVGFSDASCGG